MEQDRGHLQLRLSVDIPVQNDNFFSVLLDGDLNVFLFDQMAGNATLPREVIRSTRNKGSAPFWLHIDIDANQLTPEYAQNVINRCSLFHPHQIVFIIQGGFTTRFLAYHSVITTVDTYCMVSCSVSPAKGAAGNGSRRGGRFENTGAAPKLAGVAPNK